MSRQLVCNWVWGWGARVAGILSARRSMAKCLKAPSHPQKPCRGIKPPTCTRCNARRGIGNRSRGGERKALGSPGNAPLSAATICTGGRWNLSPKFPWLPLVGGVRQPSPGRRFPCGYPQIFLFTALPSALRLIPELSPAVGSSDNSDVLFNPFSLPHSPRLSCQLQRPKSKRRLLELQIAIISY